MLPAHAGADAYRRLHIETRTPLELIVILYDTALFRIAEARAAIERNDLPARRDAVSRAMAIVSELQSTLNLKDGGEIAASLDSLYSYATAGLIEASMHTSSTSLNDVEKVLKNLRDAWCEISTQERRP